MYQRSHAGETPGRSIASSISGAHAPPAAPAAPSSRASTPGIEPKSSTKSGSGGNRPGERFVVVDAGTETLRAGFSGGAPAVVMPTHVEVDDGGEVRSARAYENGSIANWPMAQRVWAAAFQRLRVDPSACSVLVAVSPGEKQDALHKLADMLFTTFRVPSLCFYDSLSLSVLASDADTGVILDAGGGQTVAAAFRDRRVLPGTVSFSAVNGTSVTAALVQQLIQAAPGFDAGLLTLDHLAFLKENALHVAGDPRAEEERPETFHLSGGTVELCGPQFRVPEVLFDPHNNVPGADSRHVPLQDVVCNAVRAADAPQEPLVANVVVAGGNALLRNLLPRLRDEVARRVGPQLWPHVRVRRCGDDPWHAAWHGASEALQAPHLLPWCTRAEFKAVGLTPAVYPAAVDAARRPNDSSRHCEQVRNLTEQLKKLETDVAAKNLNRERIAKQRAMSEAAHLQQYADHLETRLSSTILDTSEWPRRIHDFLAYYDPECASSVPMLLRHPKYHLRPDLLLAELIDMYGPEPSRLADPNRELTDYELDDLRRRLPRTLKQLRIYVRSRQSAGMYFREFAPLDDILPGGGRDRVVVSHVDRGSPADEAGVAAGDTVVALDGKPTPSLRVAEAVRSDFYWRIRRLSSTFHEEFALDLAVDSFDGPAHRHLQAKDRVSKAQTKLTVRALMPNLEAKRERNALVNRGSGPMLNWPPSARVDADDASPGETGGDAGDETDVDADGDESENPDKGKDKKKKKKKKDKDNDDDDDEPPSPSDKKKDKKKKKKDKKTDDEASRGDEEDDKKKKKSKKKDKKDKKSESEPGSPGDEETDKQKKKKDKKDKKDKKKAKSESPREKKKKKKKKDDDADDE